MKSNYEIRAVQVDLARQMETIPFLKSFIDFIAECAGTVEHPEHLLIPNVNFAWLGSQSITAGFQDRKIAETVHRISILMRKEK